MSQLELGPSLPLQGASSIHLSDSASCLPFRPGSASDGQLPAESTYVTHTWWVSPLTALAQSPLKQFGLQLPQCSSSLSNDTPTEGTLRILRQRENLRASRKGGENPKWALWVLLPLTSLPVATHLRRLLLS